MSFILEEYCFFSETNPDSSLMNFVLFNPRIVVCYSIFFAADKGRHEKDST